MSTSNARTRTGNFAVGLRLTATLAARPLEETAAWARAEGFAGVDLPADQLERAAAWREAGLAIGTVDLFTREWTGMLSADAGRRRETVARARERIRAAKAAGVERLFAVMLAEDVALPRRETFGYMVESYGALREVLRDAGVRIAIEGWPGCNAQCCNPESYRAFLREMNSPAYGINFDPSHLLRMGIDPVRFAREFGAQVVHAHAKDTVFDAERLYEIGREQAGVFAEPLPWGGFVWRYAIPGRGRVPWAELLRVLAEAGYRGLLAIELEDMDFNGTLDGERRGFTAAREFLREV